MSWATALVALLVATGGASAASTATGKEHRFPYVYCNDDASASDEGNIYDYAMPDLVDSKSVSLSAYRGKVVLIVNVATYCGFTPHYFGLNALQADMGPDFAVLGIPCNQFGLQEPAANGTELLNGLECVRPGNGFKPNFQLFEKADVNGENELELYTYLKSRCPSTRSYFSDKALLFYNRFEQSDVRWNFEKFLISKRGKPIKRYDPSTDPLTIKKDIERLLARSD